MSRYALVNITTETVVDAREFAGTPPDLRLSEGVEWRPLMVVDPPFDPETQVRTGPVRVISLTEVTDTFTVRAMTGPELVAVADADQQNQLDMIGEVGFKALFLLDARARKLRGDPVITQATFQNQLKALRKNPVPDPDPRTPPTFLRFDASVTIGVVTGAAYTDKTFAVPGLLATDLILSVTFTAGLLPATIGVGQARVSAVDTLAMRFQKIASGNVTPAAPQALSLIVWRP